MCWSVQMILPGWVLVPLLVEMLASHSLGASTPGCANDTDIINTLLKDSYNKVRRTHSGVCYSQNGSPVHVSRGKQSGAHHPLPTHNRLLLSYFLLCITRGGLESNEEHNYKSTSKGTTFCIRDGCGARNWFSAPPIGPSKSSKLCGAFHVHNS